MKIIATSDTHGCLPPIPECDLLIVSGDVTPVRGRYAIGAYDYRVDARRATDHQRAWIHKEFLPWLDEQPVGEIVLIGGNHDYCFEGKTWEWEADQLDLHYLKDSEVEIDGFKIWGTPWVPDLPNWAFYQDEPGFKEKYDLIPEDIDILVSHGPPYGILDDVNYNPDSDEPKYDRYYRKVGGPHHVGAPFLANKLSYDLNVRLFVCGHIHEHHGFIELGEDPATSTLCANVAYMDGDYDITQPQAMMSIELEKNEEGDSYVESFEWVRERQ